MYEKKVSRISKFINQASRINVTRGWRWGGNGELLVNGCRVSLWNDKVLKTGSGNGYTTMWMYILGGVLNHCRDLLGLPGLSLVYMGVYICYQTCLFLIKQETSKNMGVYNVSELYM